MRRVWMVLAAAVLGTVGCSAESVSNPRDPSVSAPLAATANLTLVGGGTFDAARLDQGPLALWFWAPG